MLNFIEQQTEKFGVKEKLYLSFFLITFLTIFIATVSLFSFQSSSNTIEKITNEQLPITTAASAITTISARLSALAPRLLFANNEGELLELDKELHEILEQRKSITRDLKNLKDYEYIETSKNINDLENFESIKRIKDVTKIKKILGYNIHKLFALNGQMEEILGKFKIKIEELLELNKLQLENFNQLDKAHSNFIITTSPISDNAQFELIIGLEDGSKQLSNIDFSTLNRQAEILAASLEIKSEGNLLAGILETGLNFQQIEGIAPLEERFEATIGRLKTNIRRLEDAQGKVSNELKEPVKIMDLIGGGKDNIFIIQEERLRTNQELLKTLENIEKLNDEMKSRINNLSSLTKKNVHATQKNTQLQLFSGKLAIIIVSIISIIIALYISFIFVKKSIIGRVESLKDIMLAITKNDFSSDVKEMGQDEIGKMAKALSFFREKMLENIELTDKIRFAHEESEKARKEAEKANALKTEFLANMSHELRTPMNSIIGFSRAGIKRIDKWSNQEHLDNLNLIKDSGDRLLLLLNDLLDLSKLEAQVEEFDIQRNDIAAITSTVAKQLNSLINEKQVTLNISNDKFICECDEGKIIQVIVNLLSNAIKFNKPNSSIDINFEHENLEGRSAIKFSIIDRGTGVPENELEAVFDKFIQSSKTKTGAGGTGLGLAICKEIIDGHNGKIWAENNEFGGSTFSFLIPSRSVDENNNEVN